jgi:PhnB protein
MEQLTASPYINFQGRAREAFEFYYAALGGDLQLLAVDPQGPPKAAGPDDSIMHGALTSGGVSIMGTDGMAEYPPTTGDNMAIVLSGEDRERLSRIFDQLSDGGVVKQALKEEMWGDTFGYFTDKFGINWMVNINTPR